MAGRRLLSCEQRQACVQNSVYLTIFLEKLSLPTDQKGSQSTASKDRIEFKLAQIILSVN